MRIIMESAGTEYRTASERKITTPAQAYDACAQMQDLDQEAIAVLCLDYKNGMRVSELVTIGLLDQSLVHPREVFRIALRNNAKAIVLCHNHPSGDPTPSAADLNCTRRLIEASRIMEIPIMDHVVIGKGSFVSMREMGLCNFAC
jgi:DNA repair protein RadC